MTKPKPWEKNGPSPNPNGRPSTDRALRTMFAEHTPEAKDRLLAMMRGDKGELGLQKPVRQDVMLKAILEVLNRGIGMPKKVSDQPADPLEGKDQDGQVEELKRALAPMGLRIVKGSEK